MASLAMGEKARAILQSPTDQFRQRFGIFFDGYITPCYWWESFILSRRVCLIAIYVKLRWTRFVMTWLSVANIIFLLVHMIFNPYRRIANNVTETLSLFVLSIVTIILTSTVYGELTFYYQVILSIIVFGCGGGFLVWLAFDQWKQMHKKRAKKREKPLQGPADGKRVSQISALPASVQMTPIVASEPAQRVVVNAPLRGDGGGAGGAPTMAGLAAMSSSDDDRPKTRSIAPSTDSNMESDDGRRGVMNLTAISPLPQRSRDSTGAA